jgi:hypothetical protein
MDCIKGVFRVQQQHFAMNPHARTA